MKCDVLSSFTVITKNNEHYSYVIEDNISLEELNNYLKAVYKDNLDKVIFEETFGYLHR